MAAQRVFFDTNVLLYLLSGDGRKADRAEALLATGGYLSVQVLNEYVSVTRRKAGMSWDEVRDTLGVLCSRCKVEPVTIETHDRALDISERYGLAIYDSMIIASAILAGCRTLYSEDLQSGQRFGRELTVINPFR